MPCVRSPPRRLLAIFKQRMTTQVERAFGKVLEQQTKRAG